MDGVEVPGMDGSALPFYNILKEAGTEEQKSAKKVFKLADPIMIEDENGFIMAFPSNYLKISYFLRYENSSLGSQF
jgi:UDP-3-O-acyl-N-acetylglucosamine deacetylase